jgi:hypothetical protein
MMATMLREAFGWTPADVLDREPEVHDAQRWSSRRRTGGRARPGITLDGTVGASTSFVGRGRPARQGIGRDVLRRVGRQLRAEVAERSPRGRGRELSTPIGLYTSLGFRPVTTEIITGCLFQIEV